MTDLRDRAIALAEAGYYVFPLIEGGKTPAIDGWPTKASCDPDRVRTMWTDPVMGWPHGYNIGIATGPSGLLVVDVDVKGDKPGEESLEALQLLHGDLPPTLRVRTPTGGLHIYLRGEVKSNAGKLGDGLDVRSAGGYVVAPGSVTEKGLYEVVK